MVAVGTPYPLSLVYPRSWQYKRYIATKTLEYTKRELDRSPNPPDWRSTTRIKPAKHDLGCQIQLPADTTIGNRKITNILQPIINQNIDEYVTLCRRFGNKEEHPKIDYLWGKSGTSDCTPKTFTGRSTSGHSRLGYL